MQVIRKSIEGFGKTKMNKKEINWAKDILIIPNQVTEGKHLFFIDYSFPRQEVELNRNGLFLNCWNFLSSPGRFSNVTFHELHFHLRPL